MIYYNINIITRYAYLKEDKKAKREALAKREAQTNHCCNGQSVLSVWGGRTRRRVGDTVQCTDL